MTDFKLVPLTEIKPDPNQPRKYYDETAMAELIDSVKEKGVLQPILIRPNGKGMILVCGERRYRAATAAGLSEIPAVIRNLSDEEALELQIIENLQRKDVHPLEEAVAFKSLLEKGKDAKEIAARVGKSVYYVNQRIKLCSLSKEWQKAFYEGRISVSDSIKVASLSTDSQKEMLEDKAYHREIEIDSWDMKKYTGKLFDAPFDITDPAIVKKAGACTNCKFNSATAALFPEDEKSPQCGNQSCYKEKCDQSFIKRFNEALEDPEVILVHSSYSQTHSDKFITKAKDAGKDVLGRIAYTDKTPDPIQTYEEYYDDQFDPDEGEEALKHQYRNEVDRYEQEKKEYAEKVAAGKYKKAFMMDGDDRGKYLYISLDKVSGSTAKMTKTKEETGKLTAADIDAEITRIRESQKRGVEIDQNQLWAELLPHFNPRGNSEFLKSSLSDIEREVMAEAMYAKLNYNNQETFVKLFGLKKIKSEKDYHTKYDFSGIPEQKFWQMQRFFLLDVFPPRSLNNGYNHDATVCLKLAGSLFSGILTELQTKYQDKAERRKTKADARIKELQAKKKELVKPAAKKK